MSPKFHLVLIGTWFFFMVLAIINAIIRNSVYKPAIGDLRAHQVSTIIFILLILIVTFFILLLTQLQLTDTQALLMGTIWVLATISFEFFAGHFVFGNSWEKLFHDYNVFQGRIWILVPLTTFFAPYISSKFL